MYKVIVGLMLTSIMILALLSLNQNQISNGMYHWNLKCESDCYKVQNADCMKKKNFTPTRNSRGSDCNYKA